MHSFGDLAGIGPHNIKKKTESKNENQQKKKKKVHGS